MALGNPFAKSSSDDERISKRTDSVRGDRSASERDFTEDRENGDNDAIRGEERYAMLRDVNTLLPTPPELPGFHLVWLTTDNKKDSLENRFRLGYRLVHPNELPGFAMSSQKDSAVTSDRITVNEMVLAKIDLDLWKQDMIYLHHTEPNREAQALKDSVQISKDGKGRDVAYTGGEFKNGAADGYAYLGRTSAPTLAGIR